MSCFFLITLYKKVGESCFFFLNKHGEVMYLCMHVKKSWMLAIYIHLWITCRVTRVLATPYNHIIFVHRIANLVYIAYNV